MVYYTGSSRSKACLSVVGGYVNVSHKMDSNVNMSPNMSFGVLEWYCCAAELHVYGIIMKDFVIKRKLFVPDPV